MTSLRRHERFIHGEKKFSCDQCNESFTRVDALKWHQGMITHTCNNCRKEFYRRDKLMEHQMHRQGNSSKRKRDEDDSGPATKKVRGENQVGGQTREPRRGRKRPPLQFNNSEGSLEKLELKPRKDQKQDMSRFLRCKTKSILNHLSKGLTEKRGNKWSICVKARPVKPKPGGEDVTTKVHFRSSCMRTIDQHAWTV